jgi:hypothetical protein
MERFAFIHSSPLFNAVSMHSVRFVPSSFLHRIQEYRVHADAISRSIEYIISFILSFANSRSGTGAN